MYRKSTIFKNLKILKHQIRGISFSSVSKQDKFCYIYPLMNYTDKAIESFMLSWTSKNQDNKSKHSEDFKGYLNLISITAADIFEVGIIHSKNDKTTESIQFQLSKVISELENESDRWYNKYCEST
jgi:hypothetical protein